MDKQVFKNQGFIFCKCCEEMIFKPVFNNGFAYGTSCYKRLFGVSKSNKAFYIALPVISVSRLGSNVDFSNDLNEKQLSLSNVTITFNDRKYTVKTVCVIKGFATIEISLSEMIGNNKQLYKDVMQCVCIEKYKTMKDCFNDLQNVINLI
jgi:hypothetical protein